MRMIISSVFRGFNFNLFNRFCSVWLIFVVVSVKLRI